MQAPADVAATPGSVPRNATANGTANGTAKGTANGTANVPRNAPAAGGAVDVPRNATVADDAVNVPRNAPAADDAVDVPRNALVKDPGSGHGDRAVDGAANGAVNGSAPLLAVAPGRVAAGPGVRVPVGRGNGPLREAGAVLARRRGRVVLLGVLAAGTAAVLAVLVPPPTVATATLQVATVGSADPAAATARALGAAATTAFTDRVAEPAGAVPEVTSPAPGTIEVRATGPDAAAATAAVDGAVTALTEQVAAVDAAVDAAGTGPVRAELDRRAAAAASDSGGTAPDPVADQLGRVLADRTGQATVVVPGAAAVAGPAVPLGWWVTGAVLLGGLAVPVLVGVGVPAVRRGRRLLPEADPAAALRDRIDPPVLAPGRAPGAVPVLADAYRRWLSGFPQVTVVQLTAEPACDIAGELVKAATLVGDRRVYTDLTPGAPAGDPGAGVPVVRALRSPRLRQEDLRALRDGGPTVLAVQTAGTRASDVELAVAALRAVGAPPVLCLVWPGRLPRDPARVPLPRDARTRSVPV
ncbi:hypothetical protein FRP1_08355 [Pseudonocardia sp. EC080625-04]|uniref:hypothetical protein n=1 Tax=Pseudonocardia sp. EC080625-04 TaxID=1096868 RepID=UPI0006CAFE75|nr:hypothetical protein [Pseudonocardia sp. EC080625-04]ALE73104.1 hypothetical protein FRP1_08355 [Pseudonocardia sp. EC080625-04]